MSVSLKNKMHRANCVPKGIACAVCGKTHVPKKWGIAFELSEIGARFASNLFSKEILCGDWICRPSFRQLEAHVKSQTQPLLIDSSNNLHPSDELISPKGVPDFSIFKNQLIVDFVHHQCYCSNCESHNTFQFTNFRKSGADIGLEFTCARCGFTTSLNSSNNDSTSKRKEFSVKLIYASQLSGIQFAELSRMMGMIGLPCYSSENGVYDLSDKLWKTSSQILEKKFEDQLKYISALKLLGSKQYGYLNFFKLNALKKGKFGRRVVIVKVLDEATNTEIEKTYELDPDIMSIIWEFLPKGDISFYGGIDGRWSKARNANECTVVLVETIWKTILYRAHVIRERYNQDENNPKFVGASKCAEGFGVDKIMTWITEKNFLGFHYQLKNIVHDHDGSTLGIIRNHFANCNELLNVGHKAKNIKKNVGKVLKGWGTKVSIAFQTAVTMADNNTATLKQILLNYVNHWCGNYDRCYGDGTNCKDSKVKLNPITDAVLIAKLTEIFQDLANHADSYIKSANTQKNESINNAITRLAPKRNDFPKSYEGRVDMALHTLMAGENAALGIMQQLGCEVSDYSFDIMKNKQYKSDYHQTRKASEEYNTRRAYLKADQKKRHAKTYPKYTYKESEEEILCSQANASQDQNEDHVDGCDCIGACKTKKCPCKKRKQKCGSQCHNKRKKTLCSNL